jgi:hypothetical protein
MPQGTPSNPSAGVQISTSAKSFYYATAVGTGVAVRDILSSTTRRNGTTGAVVGTDWYNETTKAVIVAPTLANIALIPADGLLDMGDPVTTAIPDTAGGTASGALPAGTNYAEIYVGQDQAGGVNYSVAAAAPVTGLANGQLELKPGGSSAFVSAADLANLKFIAQDAGFSIKVTILPFHKFPQH